MGGDRASLRAFSRIPNPLSILDVGCGGGDFAHLLALRYPDAHIVGIDIDEAAIGYAKERPSPAIFEARGLEDGPKAFDVVTATLVCHHLSDTELVTFLKQSCQVAQRRVILNDLHRTWLATLLFGILAPPLFRNRLIIKDGLLSIRRGFKRREWVRLLEEAGIPLHAYRLSWHLGFRWIVEIDTTQM